MRTSKILELVKIVEDHDIGDLEITSFGTKIKISKTSSASGQRVIPPPAATPLPASREAGLEPSAAEMPESPKTQATNVAEVKSPMVGTFYRAPAPDADPFLKIGDQVSAGQAVCIIEAMKVMNEIESEVTGTVVKILVENGEPVEFDQPLFIVEK